MKVTQAIFQEAREIMSKIGEFIGVKVENHPNTERNPKVADFDHIDHHHLSERKVHKADDLEVAQDLAEEIAEGNEERAGAAAAAGNARSLHDNPIEKDLEKVGLSQLEINALREKFNPKPPTPVRYDADAFTHRNKGEIIELMKKEAQG